MHLRIDWSRLDMRLSNNVHFEYSMRMGIV
jgi:hypothetical protein